MEYVFQSSEGKIWNGGWEFGGMETQILKERQMAQNKMVERNED